MPPTLIANLALGLVELVKSKWFRTLMEGLVADGIISKDDLEKSMAGLPRHDPPTPTSERKQ